MTKEQKETIEKIERKILIGKCEKNIGIPVCISELEIVLSIIKEQEKLINKLAIFISNEDIDEEVCKHIKCVDDEEEVNCAECVKNFFINKIKQEEKEIKKDEC